MDIEPKNHFDQLFRQYPSLVEKIVKNIPLDLRWKIAVIRKDFYGLFCNLDKLKYKIVIYGILEDTFDSILNCNRIFDELEVKKMELHEEHLRKLIKVATKHGSSIIKLYMEDCAIDYEKDFELLSQFLQKLPNLAEWEVENFTNRSRQVSVEVDPVLLNLKSLSITGNSNFVKYSHFIANNTLKTFKFDGQNVQNVATIFNRQSALTSVNCRNAVEDNPGILSNLNLEEIYWNRESQPSWIDEYFLPRLISDHPTIRKIDLGSLKMNGTAAKIICRQAQQLHSLKIILVQNNIASFMEIDRLRNLEEIELEILDKMPQLDDFSKLNMPSVKKFKISFYICGLDVNSLLENFGNNWKNIEDLHVNRVKSVNVILMSFENLKALEIGRYKQFDGSDQKYPNIETFKVHNENSGIELQNLPALIQSMPNLKHLQVSKSFGLNLIHSLTSLRKLKNLQVLFKIDSNAIKFHKVDAEIIKNLCQRIPKFEIEIEITQNFANLQRTKFVDNLAEFLESDERCCIVGVDKYYRNELYEAIRLKNLKY